MTRQKRTAEELCIAILGNVAAASGDINKTAIANAVGINNILATSLIDDLVKVNTMKKDGRGNYSITKDGLGWLEVERVGRGKAGRILMTIRKLHEESASPDEIVREIGMAMVLII